MSTFYLNHALFHIQSQIIIGKKYLFLHVCLVYEIWQQFILPFHLLKNKIDILWAPEQIAPVFGSGGAKMVTTLHDLVVYRHPESCQRSNLYIQKLLLPRTLRKSSVILPVSNYIKNECLARFKFLKENNLQIVTNAGPEWKIPSDYNRSKRENFLLCVGNIEPRKNLIRLIKAYEKITDNKLKLVIVGPKGWNNSEFFNVIDKCSKKDKIEIRGFVSEEELIRLYLTCRALIYPSIYEGFGIPVLEALTMDCPVLTSKSTVMEELAGDSASYFDPYDVESIIKTIDLYFNNQIQNFSNTFSWNKSAETLLEIFNKLNNH